MVNLTLALFRNARPHSLDAFWKKRQTLKLSSHFYGRARNCWSIAIRRVQRALMYVTEGRKLRKVHMKDVWNDRISAGAQELGYLPEGDRTLLEGLARSNVLLNRQTLGNLAVMEPRTFESLNKIARVRANEEYMARTLGPFPKGVLGKL
ncbi:39S ribosomal protein L20, mitochondrial [Orchesella cincta]|uniref:39S ribosomal protein L20, mitochondrial n=1 Tax=Orchesella cincta TaxID=48709 RepID=A0A1D2N178_ORCCI|nr:39S ribosomal protein L20, mitochondrial [Orchesella cincta]